MSRGKRRKKIKIVVFLLLAIVISVLLLNIQTKNDEFNIKDELNAIESQIIGNENSNNDTLISDYDTLILVNKNNKLPDDYSMDITSFKGFKVNSVLLEDLEDMYNDALKDNVTLVINNSYRSKSEQEEIFNSTVSEYVSQGYSYNGAVKQTKLTVSEPGYSEHETGLAIDFSKTGDSNENEKMWNWLKLNAYKYGFILRYSEGKVSITNISFEPWHYRYVGKEYAKIMYESGLTLEEYLDPEEYQDVEESLNTRKLP